MRKVYLDNAATTALSPKVLEKMMPYLTDIYGNASSPHSFGQTARIGVEHAREQVARAINADPSEIVFTGCGTESDNTVLFGVAERYAKKGDHIITTNVEHHAILHSCAALEKKGIKVTYLPVDKDGLVTPEQVRDAITDKTILVSVMFANNEVGTIMPIPEIAAVCHEKGVLFHTDAVQAAGHVPVDVKAMGIDMLSISGHKFHGPKGVGVLYERKGIRLPSYIIGGEQEKGRRAGTENVAGIVGLGEALELAVTNMSETSARMTRMRDRLIEGIEATIPEVKLNGHRTKRLPNNVNFSIKYIEGESILLMLDMAGIAASSGSACTSGSLDPSHVLLALGLTHEVAHGSVRMTLGDDTTDEDIDYVLETLPKVAHRLRAMSPISPID
ncbi:MAG: cysteine desulfurase NifS [Eubacteriales bacterium]|nr:cysteine desulfurase NifS [Eubacteriales bacterium]MCI6942405.1 cysteine desulfurase NifS [Christensenellaceae bacterium]MCI7375214.1 cysteine desulfurase NifS [Christensenellaceae bacterium]MDY4696163.1 cysteine desulfurase NifS [Eubacteriales bacterium]